MTTGKPTRKSTPAGRSPRKTATARKAAAKTPTTGATRAETPEASAKAEAKLSLVPGAKPGKAKAKQTAQLPGEADGPIPEMFKRRDLIHAVAARSAVKKAEIREVMELVLDEMASALKQGRELVLPPLGKVAIKQRKEHPKGDVLISRIKLHMAKPEAEQTPLAEPPQDD